MSSQILPFPAPKGLILLSLGYDLPREPLTLVSRHAECPEDKETPNLLWNLWWLGAARPAFWLISLRMCVIFF